VHSRATRLWFPPLSAYRELQTEILAFIEDRSDTPFDDLALAIHTFQKAHCPPLRAYCESLCATPARWQDIPPVPCEAFKNPALPITTSPPDQIAKTFLTSGTSGEARGAHHFPDLELYHASIRSAWAQLDLPDLPLICLSQPPPVAPDSSLVHMFATLGGKFLIGSDAILDSAKLRILLTHTHDPILLAGTALAFLRLFESDAEPITLPPGSHALETGGYKGNTRQVTKAELYALFDQHLGIAPNEIINEYSMTELSSQFYSHGIGNPHRAPRWLRARVLKPGGNDEVADGETGLLALYDLANLGSAIAIMTRDLAIRRGTDFELIGRDPAALPRGCSRSSF